jgi:hypothetical protein
MSDQAKGNQNPIVSAGGPQNEDVLICLFPRDHAAVNPGDETQLLCPIQGMFAALATRFDNFSANEIRGVQGSVTSDNTAALQACCGMEPNGSIDHAVLERLGRVYQTFIIRNPNMK